MGWGVGGGSLISFQQGSLAALLFVLACQPLSRHVTPEDW